MNVSNPQEFLLQVFMRLRAQGIDLGIGELFAAFDALEGDWGSADMQQLQQLARLLWCHSREEIRDLEVIWAETLAGTAGSDVRRASAGSNQARQRLQSRLHDLDDPFSSSDALGSSQQTQTASWQPLPIRAPFVPAQIEERADLRSYWPVSRRYMAYTWSYLRRPLSDGPADILDVAATIDLVTRQGFFLAPVYRRRERNHAHLMLLIDQGGSMTPFHRFTRDMVETARDESTIAQVDVAYFHNVPGEQLYHDPHLTAPVSFTEMLADCASDTSVLIVSDAGAARGYRRFDRIRTTTSFLTQLKQRTTLCAWLNPMPEERWSTSSAMIIAYLIPMFQMNPDGFSNAIDVVRGQPLLHQR